MDLLSDATLLKATQVKEAPKKTKRKSHMLHPSGSGDGVGSQPKVPNESENKTTGTDKGTDSGDDGSNDDDSDDVTKDDKDDIKSDANKDKEVSDSEKTDFDEDENLNVNKNYDEEEDLEEDYVHTPDSFEFNDDEEEYDELYKDVDVKSLDAEHEKERKGDTKITDVDKNVSQEISYDQVIDDAHVLLITTHKTKFSMQSCSVSSNFTSRFLNLDNVSLADNDVASMMNVKILPKEIYDFATPVIQSTINESLENVVLAKSSSQLQSRYKAATSLTEFELKKILLDKLEKSKSGRKDKDKDEDPPAGSDQGLKKRKTSKHAEPPTTLTMYKQ
uniref:Uncharacterized protein n=1 Tax=Tanacetum cinerariifolium TaxID=118510 RepID=A0A6L2L7G6_TANCI|nr:hypothetical protein [Tanacetum cinerariifolium]